MQTVQYKTDSEFVNIENITVVKTRKLKWPLQIL